jgi:hypothetical protein
MPVNQPVNATPTVATDSTHAVDSVAAPFAPHYMQAFPSGPDTLPTPADNLKTLPSMALPTGSPAAVHNHSPLHDTGTMALMLLGAFLITISYKSGYKYIDHFFHNMFSTRKRENVFFDHTLSETRLMSALIFNTSIMLGMLLFFGIQQWVPALAAPLQANVFLHTAAFSVLALIFYLLQLALYKVLGYVFSDKVNTNLWINGFKASHSLLGLLLFPIVGIILVAPASVNFMLILAVILYFSARIVFICKGFRIFFNNLSSSIYFILYLCSVEIVPPVLFCVGTISLCNILHY